MDNQITAQIKEAITKGAPRSTGAGGENQETFEYQAARRYMNYEFDESGGDYTWIEPVTGGIGLYNVTLNPAGTNDKDLVTVSVGYIDGGTQNALQLLMRDAGTRRSYSQVRGAVVSLFRGSTMSIFRQAYITRTDAILPVTAGSQNIGNVPQNMKRGMVGVRAAITPADELVRRVFEFVAGEAWNVAGAIVSNATDKPSRGFAKWQQQSYSQIANFGQNMGRKAAPQQYRSWVRDDLTMSKGHQIDESGAMEKKPYGKIGSRARFLEYLNDKYPYQPKPFAWMKKLSR